MNGSLPLVPEWSVPFSDSIPAPVWPHKPAPTDPVVQIDYMAFVEEAKAQERYRVLRKVLDSVEAMEARHPGSRNWEEKYKPGNVIKDDVLRILRAMMA